jgi:tRNA threonylcarbamoyladenosine biosynthesis protein TsaB
VRILAVDTALGACSVAVLDGEKILAHRFELMARGHAEALAPMVDDAMRQAGIAFASLDRLAVTTGPGTFTGQRVGLAFMRGLRVALKKPLIGVTTLAAMATQAMEETKLSHAAAIHDAKRDEFYVETVLGDGPAILTSDKAIEMISRFGEQPFALAGTAAPAMAEKITNAMLSSVRQPDALSVARLALHAAATDQAPRPLYLRAPDAKLPAPR